MKHWIDKESGCNMCEPNCAEEWCRMIWEVGYDYDGCKTVESLKSLVDELIEMGNKAFDCIQEGKVRAADVEEESIRTFQEVFSTHLLKE